MEGLCASGGGSELDHKGVSMRPMGSGCVSRVAAVTESSRAPVGTQYADAAICLLPVGLWWGETGQGIMIMGTSVKHTLLLNCSLSCGDEALYA
jgi:hypothetical protein